jgi:hypothetical protein
MTDEQAYLMHAQRIALQLTAVEDAKPMPKPIILPARLVEPPRPEQPCPPARTLH